MRRTTFATFGLVAVLAAGSGIVGHGLVPGFLHPWRAALSAQRLARVDAMLERVHATREEFDVHAQDGIMLRGWKIRAAAPIGDWVILLHGQGDNRAGMRICGVSAAGGI
jgi:hypothetical protein